MIDQTKDDTSIIRDKQSFFFGLVSGVAIVSLLGFILNATGQTNLRPVAVDDKGANNQPTQPAKKVAAGERVKIDSSDKDHFRGNKNAKVTIIEFSDMQCPYCSRYHETMKQVMQAYPNDVKWVFKHFPLSSMHPYAKKAAEATECAGDQNKFWELTDMFYSNQTQLSDDFIKSAAAELKLDMGKFNDCLTKGKYTAKVDADMEYGKRFGVQGTPGSFINGISIPGAVSFADLDQTIKEELAK